MIRDIAPDEETAKNNMLQFATHLKQFQDSGLLTPICLLDYRNCEMKRRPKNNMFQFATHLKQFQDYGLLPSICLLDYRNCEGVPHGTDATRGARQV